MKPSMPEMHLYEYAVIRLVPKVEREEFINVGIVLFSKRANYLKIKFDLNRNRINAFCHDLDLDEIEENLKALQAIAEQNCPQSEISKLIAPERFRWITAVKSSVIQTSRPHVGKTSDLDQKLNQLFEEYIL